MSFSLGGIRQWHWISGAVCLVGMLLFAVTGITLNHAADIPANRTVTSTQTSLPQTALDKLVSLEAGDIQIPGELVVFMQSVEGITVPSSVMGEWDGVEFYAAWPGPGEDSWIAVDAELGTVTFESIDRGWISYFNDLHKGRNTGNAWRWFIDIFAVTCIIFSVTGLQLLMRHSKTRTSTWPITMLGVLIPFVIILLFVH
ncbi:PepSY-associated TM helix domain-containing protein [Alteromonas sp. D210916BOD_24]|uniref:PepSY-associated TM helix domain-containing protein n=1 Tax=Alteromonas sp. D210916BOD_24 TaxID=3157618 RepID=UPI00399D46A4